MSQETTPQEMREMLSMLGRNMPELIRFQALIACLQRARFLALLREGFTEAQAVELAKKVLP